LNKVSITSNGHSGGMQWIFTPLMFVLMYFYMDNTLMTALALLQSSWYHRYVILMLSLITCYQPLPTTVQIISCRATWCQL